ncbi:conserved hypothetical protein [Methylocella tundrae]|uniref:Uncharacterized protein n=1 Tax=Methylocella tundrae TaxID=227605 RepID=A0A8B6MBV2_METTU|nr:phage tail assembly protein [Methylocella tundrae]VTZ27907.1 conserved hypothetical protein [Methylocella tundrae]VTZ52483.1 conserved hypothetical protein [Methylocella tundrae]
MAMKTIVLAEPVEMHGRRIAEIVLREPTGANYLDFGDPFTAVNSNGGFFFAEDKAVVANYLDACVQHESGAHVLRLLSLADARKVKKELLSFFTDAAPAT